MLGHYVYNKVRTSLGHETIYMRQGAKSHKIGRDLAPQRVLVALRRHFVENPERRLGATNTCRGAKSLPLLLDLAAP